MDYSQVRQFLRQAEDELISLISKTDDFSEREQCLELAKQVRELADALCEDDAAIPTAGPSSTSMLAQESSGMDGSELPAYFVHERHLYKVGMKGDGRTYKKSVPMNDVESICDAIAKLLTDSTEIATSEIKAQFDGMPDYKIQVVIMALVKSLALRGAGRGRYALGSSSQPRPKAWVRALGALPDRFDLIA